MRPPQLSARLAWPACGLTLALLAAGLLLPAHTPAGVVDLAPIAVLAAANAVVGALIAGRRPQHPIGWLLLASGLLVGTAQFAGQYAYYTLVTRPGSLPWGQAMLWLAGWPNNAGYGLVVFLLLLFPTGRLLSPGGDRLQALPRRSMSPMWWAMRSPRPAGVRSEGSGGFAGLNGQVFTRLLLSGSYERHVQRCRREYRRRRNALVEAISTELPQLRVLGVAGGLHLTLQLPPGWDAGRVAETAKSEGIDVRPLSYYAHTPIEQEPGLVMGYGRAPAAQRPRRCRRSGAGLAERIAGSASA